MIILMAIMIDINVADCLQLFYIPKKNNAIHVPGHWWKSQKGTSYFFCFASFYWYKEHLCVPGKQTKKFKGKI